MLYISVGHARAGAGVDSLRQLDRSTVAKDSSKKGNTVDIVDILKLMLGIKKNPFHKKVERNSTGPFYTISAFPGYTLVTGVAAVGNVNISFRTKKNPNGNLSFFNNQFQYTQYNQIIVQSLSNFYTNNNKWQFPGDIRYLHFPTATYGLGTSTLPGPGPPSYNPDNINYQYVRFYRTVLRQVVPNTFLGIGYNLDYRWDITQTADSLSQGLRDYTNYGFHKTSLSSGPSLNFLYDTRDNANRPITGTYIDFHFVSYLKPLGSNSNWSSMIIDVRKYFPLTKKWYVVLGVWGYGWFTLNGRPPYLDMPSLGWDSYNNTGRGYAAGRFRGRNMLYLETELRFDILRNGLLGLVVFGNATSISEFSGKYFGPIQPGGGAGIRIKFNKHTSSNSCLDYGFGTHSSRGFATNINEVF
jgi:outer membrane protein assembly factor BamA